MRVKSRIVWKRDRKGGKWTWQFSPGSYGGGTCAYGGEVLIYTELWGVVKVEGGQVLYQGRRDVGFQNFCSLDDVAAIFDQNGRQIYPCAPAGQ